ncbi:hypothetical protein ACI784_21925 [Geodermatophilus sp. SYSU D01186]
MSRSRTNQALPVAAAMAVGAVLGAAVVAGTGSLATASAQSSEAAAASSSAAGDGAAASSSAAGEGAAGHDHGTAASDAAASLVPLAQGCEDSDLPPHDGNQVGPACVPTPFGEVGAAEDNPQLLITDAPGEVAVGQPFAIEVSTRNLVRDRFLPAAEGGYYLESSTLDANGLVRGHFHTACRVLGDTGEAPQPERQAVFVATEDGGGGATPDTVTVQIPGLLTAGEAQCSAWAGDGSHRIPMMVFANQMPAVDSVRIRVTADDAAEAAPPGNADAADTGAGQPTETPQRTEEASVTAQRTEEASATAERPAAETPQRTVEPERTGADVDSESRSGTDTDTRTDGDGDPSNGR